MKPSRYFVRQWTVDPNGEEPDAEHDEPASSADGALRHAAALRKAGRLAGAFERRNIRYPSEAPPGLDLPWHLYDFDSQQIDADE